MIKRLALGAFLALAAGSASAAVTFNFTNVTFAGGGTLTGSFVTNDALSMVSSYDITASAAGSFPGFHYIASNSSVTAQSLPTQYFQIDSTGMVNELRVYFASPGLTTNGATISGTFSYESEPLGGNRSFSGTVTRAVMSVPEPASWALTIAGFGMLGAALRRRRTSISFA